MAFAAPDMGWLQAVGSLESQVYFAEYSLFYKALLQKRPIICLIMALAALDMGWLQVVGSLESQVYFSEYRLLYKGLLQKRPTI